MDLSSFILLFQLVVFIHILYLIFYNDINPYIKENFFIKSDPVCDDPKLHSLKEKLKPMFAENIIYDGALKNINKKRVLHDLSLCKGDKSFTINKEDIFLCLRDENGKYYNDNILIYVLLHEVAHHLTSSIGHTPEFHEKFDILLKKAIDMNIYDPSIPTVKNYCNYKKN